MIEIKEKAHKEKESGNKYHILKMVFFIFFKDKRWKPPSWFHFSAEHCLHEKKEFGCFVDITARGHCRFFELSKNYSWLSDKVFSMSTRSAWPRNWFLFFLMYRSLSVMILPTNWYFDNQYIQGTKRKFTEIFYKNEMKNFFSGKVSMCIQRRFQVKIVTENIKSPRQPLRCYLDVEVLSVTTK